MLGISPDKPSKQLKFAEKYGLGFPLLSDPDHATAEAFGVWKEKSMYGKKYMGIERSAFLIDETARSPRPGTRSARPTRPKNLLAALGMTDAARSRSTSSRTGRRSCSSTS